MKKVKDMFRISVPGTKTIHGVEVKKLPLGAYMAAIDSLKDLPAILLSKGFPGLDEDAVLARLAKLDKEMLLEVAGNLLVTVPEQALRFVAGLLSVPYETLRDDPNIGLNGIKDILMAFWEVNDLSNFTQDVARAIKRSSLMKQAQTGSKN